jgi:hypothetical protein
MPLFTKLDDTPRVAAETHVYSVTVIVILTCYYKYMSQYNFPKTKNTIDTLYRAYKNIQVSTNSIKTVFSKFI